MFGQTACVLNGNDAWSLSGSNAYWSAPLDRRHKARHPDAVFASDPRSILVKDPARRVYRAVMKIQDMQNETERRARRAKGGMEPNVSTEP